MQPADASPRPAQNPTPGRGLLPVLLHGGFRCRSSFLFLPRANHGAIAHRGNRLIPFTGRLGLLLEAMQDVDGFLEPGDVRHTVDPSRVWDANLSRTSAHIVERLPLGQIKPRLD